MRGGYSFLVTCYDSKAAGGSGSDKIRVKIWKGNGAVVYDSQMGAADSAAPTTEVGNGKVKLPR